MPGIGVDVQSSGEAGEASPCGRSHDASGGLKSGVQWGGTAGTTKVLGFIGCF